MATKTDFAKKLLHDLRLRKERMAASQSSNNSKTAGRDAYADPGQTYRGSRQNKALELVGPKTSNSHRRSSGSSSRSLVNGESSNQIVNYSRVQSSQQIGDLSMALLLALENGGKLSTVDSKGNRSTLGFLPQRTSSFDKLRSSTSQFPTISHLHIKDISKGVQNLNKILRACSNGVNLDSYSIEVGKELLKGAIDLEESLRMLVNLQEASEYMVPPQRKNRLTLLQEDEDDEAGTVTLAEQKQLGLPRFSFDKPSRNSRELKQRLMALTYPTDTPSSPNKQALTTSNLWARLQNSKPELKSDSNSQQSKPEKARISNVIAKLMGLEELPEKIDSKTREKESSSKKKEGAVSKTTYGTNKNAEVRTRETENLAPLASVRKVSIEAKKMPPTRNTPIMLKVERSRVPPSVKSDENPPKKDFERANRTNAALGSKRGTVAVDRKQNDSSQANQILGNRKKSQENEREQDSTKQKDRKVTEKDESKEVVVKDELRQQVIHDRRRPEVANILHEKNWRKESTLQTEKRYEERLLTSNQQKSQADHGLNQLPGLQKIECQEEKHQEGQREQHITKQTLQDKKLDGMPMKLKVSPKPVYGATGLQKKQPHVNQKAHSKRTATQPIDAKPSKELPNSRHHEDLVTKESYTKRQESSTKALMNDQNATPRKLGPALDMEKGSVQKLVQEKPVNVPATGKKVDFMQARSNKTSRKIDEVMARKIGTQNKLARPLKHNRPITEEPRQRRHDKVSGSKGIKQLISSRPKEAEGGVNGTNKLERSVQIPDEAHQMHNVVEQTTIPNGSGRDECQSPKTEYLPNSNDSSQDITPEVRTISNDYQHQAPIFSEDPELKLCEASPNPLTGPYEGTAKISRFSQHEHKKVSTSVIQELLTENEKHLKEVLIKGQIFLNAAEALFKLNIPVGILHATDHNCQDGNTKLILDCGYEVMNRKGRIQELIVHPCVKISISYVKLRSLDDLVKQLYKDFEWLELYTKKGVDECDAAGYLHKMLEREIENKVPDLNSMWGFGWNETMFALEEKEDVIRDVEGQVLDGLIHEITNDLLHGTILV